MGLKDVVHQDLDEKDTYRSRSWLVENVLIRGMSIEEAADEQGVSRNAISTWLKNYGLFHLRDIREAIEGRLESEDSYDIDNAEYDTHISERVSISWEIGLPNIKIYHRQFGKTIYIYPQSSEKYDSVWVMNVYESDERGYIYSTRGTMTFEEANDIGINERNRIRLNRCMRFLNTSVIYTGENVGDFYMSLSDIENVMGLGIDDVGDSLDVEQEYQRSENDSP